MQGSKRRKSKQIEASKKEENCNSSKTRNNSDPPANADLVTLMKHTRDRFCECSMFERRDSFLENEYLNKKGLKVHKSLLSKAYYGSTKGYVDPPGKNKMLVLD